LIGQVTPVSDILFIAQDNNPDVTDESEQRQPETSYRQKQYDTNDKSRQKRQGQTNHFGETEDRMIYSQNTNVVNNNNRYKTTEKEQCT